MSSEPSDKGATRLGLSLSGGGFRATLFHFGMILALYECGLLSRVREISSVSGGSILAARMVRDWKKIFPEGDRLTDEGRKTLNDIGDELDALARTRDLRNRVIELVPTLLLLRYAIAPVQLVLWPIGALLEPAKRLRQGVQKWLTSSAYLSIGLRRFVRGDELGSLTPQNSLKQRDLTRGDRPNLHILVTNLTEGRPAEFTCDGFSQILHNNSHYGSNAPIVDAVAASASFPGLVPAFEIGTHLSWFDAKAARRKRVFLSDGGISDNLGIGWFDKSETLSRIDAVLVSDATGQPLPDSDRNITLRYAVPTLIRSLEMVSRFSNERQRLTAVHGRDGKRVYVVCIDHTHESVGELPKSLQKTLSRLRTDLDRFDSTEVRALILHGFHLTTAFVVEECGQLQHEGVVPNKLSIGKDSWSKPFDGDMTDPEIRILNRGAKREIVLDVDLWKRPTFLLGVVSWLLVLIAFSTLARVLWSWFKNLTGFRPDVLWE